MKFGKNDGAAFSFRGFGKDALPPPEKDGTDGVVESVKSGRGRKTRRCYELSGKYLYRRAFPEVSLLVMMKYEDLKEGVTYNFISSGDIEALAI